MAIVTKIEHSGQTEVFRIYLQKQLGLAKFFHLLK